MTAKGPAPSGPDPFSYVANELQPLSDYVKELMVSENPVLTMAATHFFDQVRVVTFNFLHDYVCLTFYIICSHLFVHIATRKTISTNNCRSHGSCVDELCFSREETGGIGTDNGNDSCGFINSR